MGAVRDDEPQFVEVSGDALKQAAADYARIWGAMPEDDDTGDPAEGPTAD